MATTTNIVDLNRLPFDNPLFLIAGALIAIVLLVGVVKVMGSMFSGLLSLGYLLAGIALACGFFWAFFKTHDQTLAMVCLAGLALLILIALVTRKSKRT